MNKSELELQNIQCIIDEMPVAERALCVSMVSSLMASVGHPVHGRVFMIAVAFINCQVAVHNIKMGLVNEDGSIPEKFMQGDGKVKPMAPHAAMTAELTLVQNSKPGIAEALRSAKSFVPGGYTGHKGEVLAVDECPIEQGIEAMAAERLKTLDKGKLVSMEEMQARYASNPEPQEKGFHSGGYVGDSKLNEGEVEGVVSKPAMVEVFNREKGIRELVPFDPVDPEKINFPDNGPIKPGSFDA